jgi:hypothetical protein
MGGGGKYVKEVPKSDQIKLLTETEKGPLVRTYICRISLMASIVVQRMVVAVVAVVVVLIVVVMFVYI